LFNFLLKKKLDDLENISVKNNIQKSAFFDMDNTLLVGDIGELIILAILTNQSNSGNLKLSMNWAEYIECMKKNGEPYAYQEIIKAKEGNSIEMLKDLTHELLNNDAPFYFKEGDFTMIKPKPRPNKVIKGLIAELIERKYQIYVITASSHFIAEAVIKKWFPEIDSNNVFGVKNKLNGDILTNQLEKPFPINEGKGYVIDELIKNDKPLITAGDSPNDIFMFNRTYKDGAKLIVNHKMLKTIKILKKMNSIKNTYLLKWS